jgi:hypothetical protein
MLLLLLDVFLRHSRNARGRGRTKRDTAGDHDGGDLLGGDVAAAECMRLGGRVRGTLCMEGGGTGVYGDLIYQTSAD